MPTRNALFLVLFAFLIFGFSACEKEQKNKADNTALPDNIYDLKVTNTFDFKSTRDIKMRVSITNPSYKGEIYRVNVYDDFPTIANLITSAIVEAGNELELSFRVPSSLTDIYIEKVSSVGARELQRVKSADFIAANFDHTAVLMLKGMTGSGLDCTTGCSTTYNNHNGNLSLSSGTTCITGSYSGKITVGGSAVVRICGTATISKLEYDNNATATVYFLENSIVSLGDLDMKNSNTLLLNFSDSLKVTSGIDAVGQFTNNGKMSVHGKLTIKNQNPGFTNSGDLYIEDDLEVEDKLVNNKKLLINKKLKLKSGSTVNNNCELSVLDDLEIDGAYHNYAYTKCYAETIIKGGKTMYNHDGALLSTEDIEINGTIDGTNTSGLSTIKVADNTNFKSGGEIKGYLELCDSTGINTNNGTLTSPAAFSCGNYIPTSTCNPEGFGSSSVNDADGDGVANSLDEFPNDANRAYTSYYPSASSYSTLGFEDLWPSQGDFDFNDLVISYRVKQVLNASNDVVEFYATYFVRAIGASYDNGFAFQLDDISPSEIANVTGNSITKNYLSFNSNGTESGQNKAVIVIYDSPEPIINRVGGSMFNTIKTNGTGTYDTLNVYVSFTSPIVSSKLTPGKFNPFIMINGNRGAELHLPDMIPTTKVNSQLLGTLNDDSNPSLNRFYRTKNNLPYVIEVPASFDYPAEKESISDAYSYFINWAVSEGASYTNWYENISGYRNANKIY